MNRLPVEEYRRDGFVISTDPSRLDVAAIHAYLTRSYWAEGIGLELVRAAIAGSYCFGLYRDGEQAGFARVITDHATFAYLCDVYVLETHRGAGLGRWLMECVMASPRLQGLRRWSLVTRDAHALYRQVGWSTVANPDGYMEIARPGLYLES